MGLDEQKYTKEFPITKIYQIYDYHLMANDMYAADQLKIPFSVKTIMFDTHVGGGYADGPKVPVRRLRYELTLGIDPNA